MGEYVMVNIIRDPLGLLKLGEEEETEEVDNILLDGEGKQEEETGTQKEQANVPESSIEK